MSKDQKPSSTWDQIAKRHAKTINIRDDSDDDSIQIVVAAKPQHNLKKPIQQIKIVPVPKPKVLDSKQLLLNSFLDRIKSRSQLKQKQMAQNGQKNNYFNVNGVPKRIQTRKQQINLDGDEQELITTRSKGSAKMFNQANSQLLNDDRQFKVGRYEYKPNASSQSLKNQEVVPQMKRPVVNLQSMNKYKSEYHFPKKGQSIYPPKRQPQKIAPVFRGFQHRLVGNERDKQQHKIKQDKKKMLQQKKQKKRQQEKIQNQKRLKRIASTFQNLLGIQPQKLETKNQQNSFQNTLNSHEGLNNIEMLQQIQQQAQHMQSQYCQVQGRLIPVKKAKYGLNEIVKPYDTTNALPFVKAILAHKFSSDLMIPETKKIPNVFKEPSTYQKTFHYLVINQCIADLHQRMKKAQKGDCQKLVVQILNIQNDNNAGMTQITLRQLKDPKQNSQQKFMLKNYSLSKNRLGLLTNQKHFKLQNFGIQTKTKDSKDMKFAILCLLKCPQNKKDLKKDVKLLTSIKASELQLIIRTTGNMAFFHDFQKLSTNMRQYMSISNIQYSELSPLIYNPLCMQNQMSNYVSSEHRDCIRDILGVLQIQFNRTQYQSIRQMVLREQGIVLLQGPPGTGKTSTLLGLLSAQYQFLKKVGDNRKIMICGPSNASVDHIAKRIITEGLIAGDGQIVRPMVLRVGIVQTQDKDILKHSLDHICQQSLVTVKNQQLKDAKMTTIQIRQKLQTLQKQLRLLTNKQYKIRSARNSTKQQIQTINSQLSQKRKDFIIYENMLFSFRRQKIVSRKYYSQIQSKLMQDAEIIITTLSSSGSDKIQKIRGEIACLIVDEAAQATEPNLLIALQTGVKKVLLIGDPCQLPATTLSPDSNNTLFNRSLFQRFIDSGIRPYFLNIQYRMAPLIRSFPSKMFYQNRLIDGQNIKQRQTPEVLKFLGKRSSIFIDLKHGIQETVDNSFSNYDQAKFIISLLKQFQLLKSQISIGIITPYQSQRKLLNRLIAPLLQNMQKRPNLMINTIDSFQGQQKDIIIISAVRSNNSRKIGFLLDERRINVSLTRAKYCMIVIGNGDTLGSNQIWNSYFQLIEDKKLYFDVSGTHEANDLIKKIGYHDYYNQRRIRRRLYEKNRMTFDPRKISRNQINEQDFKKTKNKKKQEEKPSENQNLFSNHKQKQQDKKIENDSQKSPAYNYSRYPLAKSPQYESSSVKLMDKSYDKNFENKYMMDQEQIDKIIAQKRKKQEQMYRFEQVCCNLKKLQKQKQNDDFYKFLFQ